MQRDPSGQLCIFWTALHPTHIFLSPKQWLCRGTAGLFSPWVLSLSSFEVGVKPQDMDARWKQRGTTLFNFKVSSSASIWVIEAFWLNGVVKGKLLWARVKMHSGTCALLLMNVKPIDQTDSYRSVCVSVGWSCCYIPHSCHNCRNPLCQCKHWSHCMLELHSI